MAGLGQPGARYQAGQRRWKRALETGAGAASVALARWTVKAACRGLGTVGAALRRICQRAASCAPGAAPAGALLVALQRGPGDLVGKHATSGEPPGPGCVGPGFQ